MWVLIVIAVIVIGVIGLIAWSGYSNAQTQRQRENREAAKYGTVSAATLTSRDTPPAPTVPAEGRYETKSVTLRMRERVGAVNMRPSADAAKLEKLIADGWEIVTQTQAPHGARMTTYVLRRLI